MKTIKFILKQFVTNEGATFSKGTIKGEFLPFADVDVDAYYRVAFTKDSKVQMPLSGEGIFEVAYEDKGLWVDKREKYNDLHIVRIKAVRLVKTDDLKKKD